MRLLLPNLISSSSISAVLFYSAAKNSTLEYTAYALIIVNSLLGFTGVDLQGLPISLTTLITSEICVLVLKLRVPSDQRGNSKA